MAVGFDGKPEIPSFGRASKRLENQCALKQLADPLTQFGGQCGHSYVSHHYNLCSIMQVGIIRNCQGVYRHRESGFDSGEGALETATTTKVGSRRENYPNGDTNRGGNES